jgi:hypothetical protein
MPDGPERSEEGFWKTDFFVLIAPQFYSSISVKKCDNCFIVKFESYEKCFEIKDLKKDNLEPFYDFVFERWKTRLANS